MYLSAGFPYWLIKSGLLFNYPQLRTNLKTDVLVMGGGISGALTAWHLIKKGIDCTIIDARSIGLGSTCASTSLLQYEIDTPLTELKEKVGLQKAIRSYQLCKDSIYELGEISNEIGFNDFQYRQSLYYAAFKKDIPFLKNEFALRQKSGFKISLLEKADVKKHFGFVAHCALLSEDAAQTDAYSFTHELLQNGISGGLKVYDRSKIISIVHQKNKVILNTENGHKIQTKKLVYATGYESVKYINKPIVKFLSTFATISEQRAEKNKLWNEDVLIWNTADPYLYMRTTNDGRILVGGRDEDFYNPLKRDKLINQKAKQLSSDFKKLFPHIDFKSEFNWAGTFGATKDGLPFIGNYKPLPNSYFALGFGGNGITFSQVAAKLICDLFQNKHNADAEIFSFNRV